MISIRVAMRINEKERERDKEKEREGEFMALHARKFAKDAV